MTTARPAFDLSGVGVSAGGRTLLHPLDLHLPAGRVVGLIGHNGSGKSTLLSVLARQRAPGAGTARLGGRPVGDWPARAFAREVAFLPQFPAVPGGTLVRELVALGRYPWHGPLGRVGSHDRAAVDAAMARTGVSAFADRPVGLLSGGEKQRASIAMCVAQQSRWLLLDEPISALDVAHQVAVMDVIRDLNRREGTGVVVVLHDVNVAARYCDELLALSAGRVVARGTPDRIMVAHVLAGIYGLRLRLLPHPGGGPPVACLP